MREWKNYAWYKEIFYRQRLTSQLCVLGNHGCSGTAATFDRFVSDVACEPTHHGATTEGLNIYNTIGRSVVSRFSLVFLPAYGPPDNHLKNTPDGNQTWFRPAYNLPLYISSHHLAHRPAARLSALLLRSSSRFSHLISRLFCLRLMARATIAATRW